MKAVLVGLLCTLAAGAFAKSPGAAEPGAANFVPIELAQRVTLFDDERTWHNSNGEILICPHPFAAGWKDKTCLDKNDKNNTSRWMTLNSMTIPGFTISGIDYRFIGSGGYRMLIVYWRAK